MGIHFKSYGTERELCELSWHEHDDMDFFHTLAHYQLEHRIIDFTELNNNFDQCDNCFKWTWGGDFFERWSGDVQEGGFFCGDCLKLEEEGKLVYQPENFLWTVGRTRRGGEMDYQESEEANELSLSEIIGLLKGGNHEEKNEN
jgi:hypothetical protein